MLPSSDRFVAEQIASSRSHNKEKKKKGTVQSLETRQFFCQAWTTSKLNKDNPQKMEIDKENTGSTKVQLPAHETALSWLQLKLR